MKDLTAKQEAKISRLETKNEELVQKKIESEVPKYFLTCRLVLLLSVLLMITLATTTPSSLLDKTKREKVELEVALREARDQIVRLEKITNKIPTDLLTLPANLTFDDIEFISVSGKHFDSLSDLNFFKQIIIDACASSKSIRGDATSKIMSALEKKTGKQVNIFTCEEYSHNNTSTVYNDHSIMFRVKGVIFIFFA